MQFWQSTELVPFKPTKSLQCQPIQAIALVDAWTCGNRQAGKDFPQSDFPNCAFSISSQDSTQVGRRTRHKKSIRQHCQPFNIASPYKSTLKFCTLALETVFSLGPLSYLVWKRSGKVGKFISGLLTEGRFKWFYRYFIKSRLRIVCIFAISRTFAGLGSCVLSDQHLVRIIEIRYSENSDLAFSLILFISITLISYLFSHNVDYFHIIIRL